MQVIKMRMGDEDQVDRWQVVDLYARLAQALQHKKPAGEVGINNYIFAAHLQKKSRMPDEGDAHLPIRDEFRLMRFPNHGSHSRMPYQPAKVPGSLAQSGIFERLF